MGYIDNLLRGRKVEWKALGEVAKYEQPSKYLVHSTKYSDSFPTPVLTAGKSFILGYTDESTGIYRASEAPIILFDDFTTASRWVDFDFKVKSSATKIITSRDESVVLLKYIYYWLNTLPSECVEGDHKRRWISTYTIKKIPLPPLDVQVEIARILDRFTALEAELEARQKQYEYYRDRLLSADDTVRHFKLTPLGDIGEVRMCKRILKGQTSKRGDVPFYKIGTFGDTPDAFISRELFNDYRSKYNYPKVGDILISASGTIGRTVVFDGKEAYFQDSNIVWIENDERYVLNAYLYYCYQVARWEVTKSGTIQRLYNENLRRTPIPIPFPDDRKKSLAEQARIVRILDKFSTLTTSLTAGLPREIALRRRQYEYYREQLLSFE